LTAARRKNEEGGGLSKLVSLVIADFVRWLEDWLAT
jgi:hypothetical protein